MTPVDFPEANMTLCAPKGMEDSCGNLPVYRRTDGIFVSAWMPSQEEKEAIAKGASIMLYVIGNGHPPVTLQVTADVEVH
jgi:hypothetical protein